MKFSINFHEFQTENFYNFPPFSPKLASFMLVDATHILKLKRMTVSSPGIYLNNTRIKRNKTLTKENVSENLTFHKQLNIFSRGRGLHFYFAARAHGLFLSTWSPSLQPFYFQLQLPSLSLFVSAAPSLFLKLYFEI